MLIPKKVKHRKHRRGRMAGNARGGNKVDFGSYGMMAVGRGWLTARQIEASRRTITRYIKKGGKVWIRVFPDKPVTARPPETRMGGGKGAPEKFVCVVKPGRILFELDGVTHDIAKEAFKLAGHKMPFKTRFVSKEESNG